MIALFGGTFDPVHVGHVAAAQAAARLLGVDAVHLVVAAQPYHKVQQGQGITSAEHRLAMLEIACRIDSALVADGSELGRIGASYTVDLLERRRQTNPRERRVWVIGWDAFAEITSWRRWQRVFELTNFLVFERAGHKVAEPDELRRFLDKRLVSRLDGRKHGQVMMASDDLPEVSATQVRRLLASSAPCEHLLPSGVYPYIKQHDLYAGSSIAR